MPHPQYCLCPDCLRAATLHRTVDIAITLDDAHARKLSELANDNDMTSSEAVAWLLDYHADYLISGK